MPWAFQICHPLRWHCAVNSCCAGICISQRASYQHPTVPGPGRNLAVCCGSGQGHCGAQGDPHGRTRPASAGCIEGHCGAQQCIFNAGVVGCDSMVGLACFWLFLLEHVSASGAKCHGDSSALRYQKRSQAVHRCIPHTDTISCATVFDNRRSSFPQG